MSQTQEKKDVIGEDSTVIQCPSCLTRFAVEAEAVHASEEPRFHCSRCDYVFPLDEANVTVPLTKPGLIGEPVAAREERNPWAESPLASKTFEVPKACGTLAEREPPVEALVKDDESQISFRFPSVPQASRTRSEIFGEPSIVRARSESFENILEPSSQPHPSDFTVNQSVYEQDTSTPSRDYETSLWSGVNRNPFADIARAEVAASIAARVHPASNHPVLTIAAPLLLFLAILGGFSYYLHTNPRLLDEVGKGILARIPETPPPGLYIDRAQVKRVVLDNGETVLVLAGGLINQTDKAFREVVLEGLAFDSSGQSVIRSRVKADQNIGRTKIHGLSVPLIQEQQNKRRSNRFSMKPGERQQFEFALLSPDASQTALKQARSFSARIYSVQTAS